jgi:hypothetical protein
MPGYVPGGTPPASSGPAPAPPPASTPDPDADLKARYPELAHLDHAWGHVMPVGREPGYKDEAAEGPQAERRAPPPPANDAGPATPSPSELAAEMNKGRY